MVEQLINQSKEGGSIPTSPLQLTIRQIPKEQAVSWVLKKHYAHRMPPISLAFGLYNDRYLYGVCTLGMVANYVEMKAWEPFEILELNRLVISEGMPGNSLSFFVSRVLHLLPKPRVVISYADIGKGHQGYIYQATNWIFTGVGGEGCKVYILKNGYEQHQRHGEDISEEEIDHIEYTTGKNRYYYFVGDKKDVRQMRTKLRFPALLYPKGDNQRYNASYEPIRQGVLI